MLSCKPNVLDIVSLCGNKSEVITRAPWRLANTAKMMPIGPWPMTRMVSPRRKPQSFNTFHASIDRLDKRRLLERDTVRDANHAFLNDPVHYADVLGKSAAAGFITGGRADLLVGRALRENLMPAVVAIATRDVVKDDNAVADSEVCYAVADRGYGPGRLVPEDARSGVGACGDLLKVGAANATGMYADQDLSCANLRDGHALKANVIYAAIDGGLHGRRNRSISDVAS